MHTGAYHDRARHTCTVLVVHDALHPTGSVRWTNVLVGRWVQAGHQVRLFVLVDPLRGSLDSASAEAPLAPPPAGVPVTCGGKPGQRLRRALPRSLPRLANGVRRSCVVLVPSEVGWSLPLSFLLCRILGRRLVVMAQSIVSNSMATWTPRGLRWLWLRAIRWSAAVICVSPGAAEAVRALGVPERRIMVAHTGIDVDEVRNRARSRPRHFAGEGFPVLLACGELCFRKGHDVLLRSFAVVLRRGYQAHLIILGEGPERQRLEALAADLGIADDVQLPGFFPEPLPDLAAADLFVHSARTEAAGLVLLEALSLGVPTVATDAAGGGPRTILDAGRFGDLVPPESELELADAICRHLEHPDTLRERAVAASWHIRRRYAPDTAAVVCWRVLQDATTCPSAAGIPTAPANER